jgi:protein-L-isoaspartate(D-aspartate) O-methyltransferase
VRDADFFDQRALLASRLASAGHSPAVVHAFAQVPRHLFVPEAERAHAYADRALPIGEGQTISQPSMIAMMLDALKLEATDRVLEVGAGSGYAAALLGCIVAEVVGLELSPILAARAEDVLRRLDLSHVHVLCRDGWNGLPEAAPFDAILVSAAPEVVPAELPKQLRVSGRIAIPVGDRGHQMLRIGTRTQDDIDWQESVPCLFVPLVHPDA